MGADSLRTYDAGQLSDELKSCGHGLDILAGIAIDPGEPTDAAVGRAVDFVNANKGIPCIKYWVIGNELENAMGQGAAFAKINAVAGAVKYADPSRRTTSCVAGVEDGRPVNLKNQASNIDVPCINCYQCADTMCARLTGMGFGGEYILGEVRCPASFVTASSMASATRWLGVEISWPGDLMAAPASIGASSSSS